MTNAIEAGVDAAKYEKGHEPKTIEWRVARTDETVPEAKALTAAFSHLKASGYHEGKHSQDAFVLRKP